jgi:hypothetical protein
MTRRSKGRGRVTRPAEPAVTPRPQRVPSFRHRNPLAYWVAIIGAGALVVSTFAMSLSAFL